MVVYGCKSVAVATMDLIPISHVDGVLRKAHIPQIYIIICRLNPNSNPSVTANLNLFACRVPAATTDPIVVVSVCS